MCSQSCFQTFRSVDYAVKKVHALYCTQISKNITQAINNYTHLLTNLHSIGYWHNYLLVVEVRHVYYQILYHEQVWRRHYCQWGKRGCCNPGCSSCMSRRSPCLLLVHWSHATECATQVVDPIFDLDERVEDHGLA